MNRIKEVGEDVAILIQQMQTAITLPGGVEPDGRGWRSARPTSRRALCSSSAQWRSQRPLDGARPAL